MADNNLNHQHRTEYYEDEINILDYWRVLVKYKKLILIIVSLAFIISLIISFILPETYVSKSSILAPRTHVNQWIDILKSRSLRDAIIERFDLETAYEVKTRAEARNSLDDNVRITKTAGNTITIAIEDRMPERAAQLTNAFVEELVNINKTVVTSNSKRKRIFLEKRLEESNSKLEDIENSAREFLESNEAIKLDAQASYWFDTIVYFQGLLLTKEMQLQILQEKTKTDDLRTEINALKKILRELEQIFIPMSKLNPLGLKYARMLRELKTQETLNLYLSKQLEVARLLEVQDSPTVQVLDRALVPGKKSKPKRKRIVILSFFISVFISVFLAFLLEYIEHLKDDNSLEAKHVERSR